MYGDGLVELPESAPAVENCNPAGVLTESGIEGLLGNLDSDSDSDSDAIVDKYRLWNVLCSIASTAAEELYVCKTSTEKASRKAHWVHVESDALSDTMVCNN